MIQIFVQNRPQHIGKHERPRRPSSILDDNEAEVDNLKHEELDEPIIALDIAAAEVYVAGVDDWVKIAFFVKFELPFEIHVEIYNIYSDFTLAPKQPMAEILMGLNNKIFVRWKIKIKKPVSFPTFKTKFDFIELNFCVGVVNIDPVDFCIESFDAEPLVPDGVLDIYAVMIWSIAQLSVRDCRQKMGEEFLDHSCVIPMNLQHHAWIHFLAPVVAYQLLVLRCQASPMANFRKYEN